MNEEPRQIRDTTNYKVLLINLLADTFYAINKGGSGDVQADSLIAALPDDFYKNIKTKVEEAKAKCELNEKPYRKFLEKGNPQSIKDKYNDIIIKCKQNYARYVAHEVVQMIHDMNLTFATERTVETGGILSDEKVDS